MVTYAQRHPDHVRSVVLSGAYAVNVDASGSVAAQGLIRAITLAGERTVGKLYSGSPDPDAQLALATAAAAARTGDMAPIRRFVEDHLRSMADIFTDGPTVYSGAASWATACHDYPRPFDYGDMQATRDSDLAATIASQSAEEFGPFSAEAWLTRASYDLGVCLNWPGDENAQPPYPVGAEMPGVPVLVLSGDLDANTTSESGRDAAARFPKAGWVEVVGAGHTPSVTTEGQRLITDFISAER